MFSVCTFRLFITILEVAILLSKIVDIENPFTGAELLMFSIFQALMIMISCECQSQCKNCFHKLRNINPYYK